MESVEDRLITLAEAAELTGKSARWVQILAEQGWIERAERGRYRLAAVLSGVAAYLEAGLLARGGTENASRFVREKRAYVQHLVDQHRAAHRRMIAAVRKELAALGADPAAVRAAVARIEAAGKG